MKLYSLTENEFDNFAKNHELSSYHQSTTYAKLMKTRGYTFEYLGLIDDQGEIKAATLLLMKKIKKIFKYAYAPKGFLINYKDKQLLSSFTKEIKKYARENKIIFIKLNPEIPIAKIDYKNNTKQNFSNEKIIKNLTDLGYSKLRNNLNFESLIPRYNTILNLKKANLKNYDRTNRNKIHNAERKGLIFEHANYNKTAILYPIIEGKKRRTYNYYNNYYKLFKENGEADLFLVKVDYEKYLINSKELYEYETEINKKYTETVFNNPSNENINKKMNSDRNLVTFKKDIIEATFGLKGEPDEYIAGALCIKHKNHVHIVISGYKNIFGHLNPNYFLHNEIFKYYKNEYDYIDLNGVVGDLDPKSKYYGLNKFKFGFNPDMYEFIGEFDLISNYTLYNVLLTFGLLKKEFKKD